MSNSTILLTILAKLSIRMNGLLIFTPDFPEIRWTSTSTSIDANDGFNFLAAHLFLWVKRGVLG